MLPLLLTVLLAVYILGPGLLSRWVLSFLVPQRAVIQGRSEEIARAFLWSLLPLWLAWEWAKHLGRLSLCGGRKEIATVYSGMVSDAFFNAHRADFFNSVTAFLWMNWCLLWRLYLMVIAGSFVLILIIGFYGPIRQSLERSAFLKALLAILILPRVSDWHVLLSRMLVPSKSIRLFVDVLTRSDNLYQGRLADKMLGADGTLINVTLAEPAKFQRARYLEALKTDPNTSADNFWNKIPGEIFIVLASEIATMNIRYVQAKITSKTAPEIIEALQAIIKRLG